MSTVAAPVIKAEMADWQRLGGGNSGIVGDPNHTSGFHIGARYLPASDYSRRRDPNGSDGPFVDWDWACAGDFSHRNVETLRAHHRRVLNGLMNGQYPMICEFIGKPWADRPVYYWARWNGIKTLQQYTGSDHTHWSHISWWRSRADERANLWTPQGGLLMLPKRGDKGEVVKFWQRVLEAAGYEVGTIDGDYGPKTAAAVNKFRADRDLGTDDEITGWMGFALMTEVFKGQKGDPGKPGAPGQPPTVEQLTAVISAWAAEHADELVPAGKIAESVTAWLQEHKDELRGEPGKTPTEVTFTGLVTKTE